jgi:superfamily II DNA helicase RecQ
MRCGPAYPVRRGLAYPVRRGLTRSLLITAPPQRCFGYGGIYTWQREVMEALLAGTDAIVARPTGGGKSLCFQLPALVEALRPRGAMQPFKTTVVIVPNVSLMIDQVRQLNERLHNLMGDDLSALGVAPGKEVAALLGTAQTDPDVARAAKDGEYRLLYITERLLLSSSTDPLASPWVQALQTLHRTDRLLLLAVDEAHVVRHRTLERSPQPHPPRRHTTSHPPLATPQVTSPLRHTTSPFGTP